MLFKNIFNSVLVYFGSGYVGIIDRQAEDSMADAVEEVRSGPDYNTCGKVYLWMKYTYNIVLLFFSSQLLNDCIAKALCIYFWIVIIVIFLVCSLLLCFNNFVCAVGDHRCEARFHCQCIPYHCPLPFWNVSWLMGWYLFCVVCEILASSVAVILQYCLIGWNVHKYSWIFSLVLTRLSACPHLHETHIPWLKQENLSARREFCLKFLLEVLSVL